jgi:transcriptional regulator with XRE-family HTH domain
MYYSIVFAFFESIYRKLYEVNERIMRKNKEALPIYSDFGRRVREKRISAGMKCSGLAEKIGAAEDEVSAIEDGRGRPDSKTIDRIAGALDVSRLWLLTGLDQEVIGEQIKREGIIAAAMGSFIAGRERAADDRAAPRAADADIAHRPHRHGKPVRHDRHVAKAAR